MVELSPKDAVPPARPPRFALLDGLRFVAAMFVLCFHYFASTKAPWVEPMYQVTPSVFNTARYGFFGVDLFFVISGFVILMSAWGRPLGGYVASRIARLFPGYWFGVIFTGSLLLATAPKTVSVQQILVNLTMAQSAFNVPPVDGVYWTLWVELHFYLMIGALLLVGISRERVLLFAGLWPIIAILAQRSDSPLVAMLLEPTYAPLFAGGMLIYLLSIDRRSVITWLLLGANIAWALPTAGADAATSIANETDVGINQLTTIAVVVGCFLAVLLVTVTPLRRVSWKWLSVVGLLTYPLYLVHEELGWTIIGWTSGTMTRTISVALACVASFALAIVINVFVERPIARPLRQLIERGIAGVTPRRAARTRPLSDIPPSHSP